jgi:hypothetical protein
MLYTFVTIYDFQQTFVETIRLVRPKSEKLPFGRGSQAKKGEISPTAITEALNFFLQFNVRKWLPYSISLAAIFTRLNVAVPVFACMWHHTAVCVATSIFSPHD